MTRKGHEARMNAAATTGHSRTSPATAATPGTPATAWSRGGGLFELVGQSRARAIAIIGLVKNAGKTTVANAIMANVGRRFGLTSLGLDGERTDHLTGLAKPRIVPPDGTLVATTTGSLDRCHYHPDIVAELPFRTALGRVVIGRATGGAPIEVSGPTTLAQVRATVDALLDLGAEQVLVDGAINRLGSASPRVTNGLIMATGGMVGESLDEAVQVTADTFAMLTLPAAGDETLRLLGAQRSSQGRGQEDIGDTAGQGAASGAGRLVSVDERGRQQPLEIETAVGEGAAVCREIERLGTRTLYCSGALTQDFVDDLVRVLPPQRPLRLVVRDATVLVLPSIWVWRLRRRGIQVEVVEKLDVLAVTTNPFRLPQPLNARLFFDAVVDAIGDRVPVFDVVNGLAHVPGRRADAGSGPSKPTVLAQGR
jgi:hypothetical protein